MIRSATISLAFCSLLTGLIGLLAGSKGLAAPQAEGYQAQIEPLLSTYCFDCHADGAHKGDFEMDDHATVGELLGDRSHWLKIWHNTRAGLMPPADKKQPSDAEREKLLSYIETQIFGLDPKNPDPGRVTIRRLNREEYRNTIKDLFGVDFDTDEAFPADDTGYGFDTIGDVLSISPLLMEKYLEAATDVVAKAVSVEGPKIPTLWIPVDLFKDPKSEKAGLKYVPFNKSRTLLGRPWVNHDGEYQVNVEFAIKGSMEATSHSATLRFGVGDKTLVERKLGWDNSKTLTLQTKAKLLKGRSQDLRFTIEPGEAPQPGENELVVQVSKITAYGPLDGSVKEYPSQFQNIFFDGPPPEDPADRDDYRRRILTRLATRVFRRPVDAATVERLVALARAVDEEPGKRFEHGIAHALTALLASPRFLLRAEIQSEPDNPAKVVPVDEYALASRLSYFLWSSTPDDELMRLAGEGNLRKNLRAQVDRLLADPKSGRFTENFIGQWLEARDVETINVDARRVLGIRDLTQALRVFNRNLRGAMRQETEMLFSHVLKENLPATELLNARYTFLNEELAKWYGIPDVKGKEMRLVELPEDSPRGGLLSQGTFLIVTSNPARTSPVKRGRFVLENFLATPPPPAPPNVPALEESQKGKNKDLPLREILAIHREKPLCASCHERMDPIGLALENFDALGVWHDDYRGRKIEASGQLITGETFADARELAEILASKRFHDFHRALAEKLLTYAIGRGVEIFDAPTIDDIVGRMEGHGSALREVIYGVIESAPFQKRRGDGNPLAQP